jgi:glucokinase
LRATARNVFKLPVVVDNDAAAAAYGEYVRGSGKGCECFICITLGTGVGGGIVIGGELLRGANNFTAEIGHITISENGPKCTCGNRGCLEAFVGASALVGRAREEMRSRRGRILGKKSWARREVLSPRVLARAAAEGDGIARMVFAEAGARLGCAAATLANIFNPEVIAVTGGVAGAFEFMEGSLRRELEKRAFAATANVKVTRALLGKDASMIGAALLAAAG